MYIYKELLRDFHKKKTMHKRPKAKHTKGQEAQLGKKQMKKEVEKKDNRAKRKTKKNKKYKKGKKTNEKAEKIAEKDVPYPA